MAKGVLIQPSFYDAICLLQDKDRLALYDAICKYGIYGEEPSSLPASVAGYFTLMKPNIDSSNKRYSASVENGKKGGAPKGNQNAKKTTEKQPKNNQTKQPKNNHDYDLDYDYDLDSDKDKECIKADKPPRSRFSPPSVEEVREYCQERKNSVDPERFIDYYTSNGWMVGKNKMKDWKAAVRSWEKSNDNRKQEVGNGGTKEDNEKSKYYLPGQIVL